MKKDNQITGNIGMYYVCYMLSELGINVMPTARNAAGIDIVAYSPDGSKYTGIQVKTLSSATDVPLKQLKYATGQWWCIVICQRTGVPKVYIMANEEVINLAWKEKDGSCWLEKKNYAKPEYAENWLRILKDLREKSE